jgi:hypothetical protein
MRERIGRRQKALERSVRELRAGKKQGLYRRVHQILMINEDALRFVRVDDFVGDGEKIKVGSTEKSVPQG